MVRILTEHELRSSVGLDAEGLAAIEGAFVRYADGEARVPPIIGIEVPEKNGACDVKAAYLQGWSHFAVKISTRFFDNPERFGISSGSGMMALLSSEKGVPEALLLDNGYLTSIRTALAGAIAAKHLAIAAPRTVAVIGAGSQGRMQVQALELVRSFERVLVQSRSHEHAERYAEEMPEVLGCEVEAVRDPEEAVGAADIVVTTTPATEPVVRAAWLRAGVHVTAMGADAAHKNELEPRVLARADLLVCDSRSQCLLRGDLHHAVEAAAIAADAAVVELGELCAGRHPGRTREDEITVCDLTGVGVQDTAIATLAYRRACDQGLGTELG